jgi:hypothetical protein
VCWQLWTGKSRHMKSLSADWIRALAPQEVPGGTTEPASSSVTVAVATATLGAGPVAWAVQIALEMAQEVVAQVPEHGGGPAPFATLRSTVEATVLAGLCGLAGNIPPGKATVSKETAAGAAEFAHRSIPLDRVLRGVRIGHARLHQALAAVIDTLPEPARRAENRRVSDLLFGYADAHASLLAETYLVERAQWLAGLEAGRRRIVEELLAGKPVPTEAASQSLGYELTRHHQAFLLVADDREVTAAGLHRCAEDLSSATAADGWISLPAVAGEVWAWAGWRVKPTPGPSREVTRLRLPPGIRVSAGPVAHGPEGLRRSHFGAREAERIAAATTPGGGWCDYTEVRTLSLATADTEQARWYAQDVLGPLLTDDTRTRELRETLMVYLACERSPQKAAEQLHVARNTVSYRVHKAEVLLGQPIGDPMELRLALEIARLLQPAVNPQG